MMYDMSDNVRQASKQMSTAVDIPLARQLRRSRLVKPVLSYTVPGIPRQQGDLQAGWHGKLFHKGKGLEKWRFDVAWRAGKAMRDNGFGNVLFGGPIALTLMFVLHRPVNAPKTKPTEPAIRRPDLDKLARAIGDALTDVVYVDDSQVVEEHHYKRTAEIGEETGVLIEVKRVVRLGDWEDECAT